MRTIEWVDSKNLIRMIDQRKLPGMLEYLECGSVSALCTAIQEMAIRGAPALGVVGAFGIALAAWCNRNLPLTDFKQSLHDASILLMGTRPTAVNLMWGINRVLRLVDQEWGSNERLFQELLTLAKSMADEDVRINLSMAKYGAELIEDGDTIIHHCNTGALAAVDWGTALGAIRYAHEQGKRVHVLVDETRPRLQGARLTAWECEQYGIPYEIISDNAAGFFLSKGQAQKVFFGADRVSANGDVINKVGTYMLSLAAHANHVPVICVFPTSTIDQTIPDGSSVVIEERPQAEVLGIKFMGDQSSPSSAHARNPAFDVTPHNLVDAWVTENGVIYPPFKP